MIFHPVKDISDHVRARCHSYLIRQTRVSVLVRWTHCLCTVCAFALRNVCECVSSRQDSTEGEDILLLPQENSTTVQECLICNAILLHTHTHTIDKLCRSLVVQQCMAV